MFFGWKDDMRRWTVDGSDKTLLGLITVLGAGAAVLGAVVASMPYDPTYEVISIPDRFADVVYVEADESAVAPGTHLDGRGPDGDAVIEFGAFDKGRAGGQEGRSYAQLKRAKGDRQRREQLKQDLMEQGLIPLYGSSGGTTSDQNAAGMFGDGGIGVGSSSFIGGVIGAQSGNQWGSGGLSSRGSGLGGHGTGEHIGGIGTRGGSRGGGGYSSRNGFEGRQGGTEGRVTIGQGKITPRSSRQEPSNRGGSGKPSSGPASGFPEPWLDPPAGFTDGTIAQEAPKNATPPPGDPEAHTIPPAAGDPSTHDPALLAFYARTRTLDDLTYQPPTGYWANTYIPGDPRIRQLDVRVRRYERSRLGPAALAMGLEDLARRTTQPFDPPESAAMALYLHASERSTTEPRRMTVQVGLQGVPLQGGQRPAMKVAVVLDLRQELTGVEAALVGELLEELESQRDLADRFTLTVAGRPGGTLLEPAEFRRGRVLVTMQQLAEDGHEFGGPTLGLQAALGAAAELARGGDDSIPGSSLVVLVTAAAYLGPGTLDDRVHQLAVSGVPTSVVGVGHAVSQGRAQELALAGQGRSRWLQDPDRASTIVRDELLASSRTVARALRLRIRLAPGVELVDVLGSYRLGERRSQQVREAEQSIDRTLAKQMGIESDRGEDEDGIQIVIPAFRAGDSHVILLDLVVPGPGPVAEATVRYKDLVYLRNGVARSSLQLDRGARAAGPLERNVTKNLLAYELSRALWEAGELAASGDIHGATAKLDERHRLLTAISSEVDGFGPDPDIRDDVRMLGEYGQLFEGTFGARSPRLKHLSASLQLAGLAKVHPRPPKEGALR